MPAAPTLIAFDTSAAHCAAALLRRGVIVAERHEEMGRGQAERLMPLLGEMLAGAGLAWQDLDAVAVGVGPGNFTGIRIAVSAARGLALGLAVPAIGITGFEALARGVPGPVLAVLPAPRGTLFVQFLRDGVADGPPRQLAPDEVGAAFALPAGTCVVGHEAAALGRLLGRAANPRATDRLAPAIAWIAAARLGSAQPRPAPLYVRPADAAPPTDTPPVILP